jgi:GNAT superfamily N-acetyltransferase
MHVSYHDEIPESAYDGLFRKVYRAPTSEERFDWKYRRNPHGHGVAWAVAGAVPGEWIAAAALLPRLLRVGRAVLRAGQIVDIMVAPSARRQGHFRRIVEHIWREHPQHGFDLLVTLVSPGSASMRGFATMPVMREVGRFAHFARPLRHGAFTKRLPSALRSLAAPVAALGLRWLDRSLAAPATVERDAPFSSADEGFVVDEAWVAWRRSAPDVSLRSFRWDGGGALVALRDSAAELYALRGTGLAAGLSGVLGQLREQQIDSVRMSARVPPALEEALRSAGFVSRKGDGLVAFAGSHRWDDPLHATLARMALERADLDVA